MFLAVGQISEYPEYLFHRQVKRAQVKSTSLYVNGLIKNQNQQTNKKTSQKQMLQNFPLLNFVS